MLGGTGRGHLSIVNDGTNTVIRGNTDIDVAFEFELVIKDGAVDASVLLVRRFHPVTMRLEVCVDDALGLAEAVAGGADRVELCAALSVGGLTPTAGLMAQAAASGLPCYPMIRPRPGSFVFDRARRDDDACATFAPPVPPG